MSVLRQREFFMETWREDHDGQDPPWRWGICDECDGHGTSTAYLGAYTQADREEMGEEWYEFMNDVRAGVYDVSCDGCGGSGKIKEFTGSALDAWFEWVNEYHSDLAVRRAESGYRD